MKNYRNPEKTEMTEVALKRANSFCKRNNLKINSEITVLNIKSNVFTPALSQFSFTTEDGSKFRGSMWFESKIPRATIEKVK